jgi:acylphosphatase
MAKICAHVYVSGYVQGVAFRYSAIRQANNLGVTGWVKNLRDGRVEVLIEGDESDVKQMVDWCSHGPRGAHVTDIQTEIHSYTGNFHDFDVIF